MGGYLATITSDAENNFLGQLAQPFYPLSAAANIGGYQDLEDPDYSEPGGAWKWITGEPFEYTNWQSGEPGCCAPNEDWLDFNAQSAQWRDRVNCLPNEETSSQWALIEWSADCNGDSIADYGQILSGELTDADGNGVPDVCEECPGDIIEDGVVNLVDFSQFLIDFGSTGESISDLNGDLVVDTQDFSIFLINFGNVCETRSAVAETGLGKVVPTHQGQGVPRK